MRCVCVCVCISSVSLWINTVDFLYTKYRATQLICTNEKWNKYHIMVLFVSVSFASILSQLVGQFQLNGDSVAGHIYWDRPISNRNKVFITN